MSDFDRIELFVHARQKLYKGILSKNDFRVIVDKCSESPFEIITQKIKKMGEEAIKELELRAQRNEKELSTYSEFCDFDEVIMDGVLD